jgi:hypothetical protein
LDDLLESAAKIFWLEKVASVPDGTECGHGERQGPDAIPFARLLMEGRQETPWNTYWHSVSASWERCIRRAAKQSPPLLALMQQQGYPRLLRLVREMFSRLSRQLSVNSLAIPDAFEHQKLVGSLQSLENAFLSRSLGRLTDPINSALAIQTNRSGKSTVFGTSSQQQPSYLQSIAKSIRVELEIAKCDSRLLRLTVKNVSKALQMYAVKSESLVRKFLIINFIVLTLI